MFNVEKKGRKRNSKRRKKINKRSGVISKYVFA